MTNPYAPPTATVADAPERRALPERPKQVSIAVAMLWASLALGVVSTALGAVRDPSDTFGPVVLTITGFVFAFMAYLCVQLRNGKNWARIAWLIMATIGAAAMFLPSDEALEPSTVETALLVIELALEFAALGLCFAQPGALWFKAAALD